MKATSSLLFAGAVALGFTITAASATEITASPRFRQTLNERDLATSTASSPNLVANTYLGSTAKWGLNVPNVAPGGPVSPNLVSGNYAGAASKHPYPPPTRFEIAPLMEKGKTSKTCGKDCCVKK